eukprot:8061300-Pyramimonas_sp.AAC.1
MCIRDRRSGCWRRTSAARPAVGRRQPRTSVTMRPLLSSPGPLGRPAVPWRGYFARHRIFHKRYIACGIY